jgi:hypothetical protein
VLPARIVGCFRRPERSCFACSRESERERTRTEVQRGLRRVEVCYERRSRCSPVRRDKKQARLRRESSDESSVLEVQVSQPLSKEKKKSMVVSLPWFRGRMSDRSW